MPRRLRTPPKYCRHRKSGLAYVFLVGKRRYLGKYGTPESREKYDQFVAAWRADGDPRKPMPRQNRNLLRCKSFSRDSGTESPSFWRNWRSSTISETRRIYVKAGQVTREAGLIREAALALLCDFPHSRVDAIGPLEIDQFRGRLIGEQSWSRKHLNKQIDRIKRMFRWGVEKAIVTPAVYHAIAAVSAWVRGDPKPASCCASRSSVHDCWQNPTKQLFPDVNSQDDGKEAYPEGWQPVNTPDEFKPPWSVAYSFGLETCRQPIGIAGLEASRGCDQAHSRRLRVLQAFLWATPAGGQHKQSG